MAARETTNDSSTCTMSLKCTKCHNHYDDPRMLPCLHSFCKSCVGQLVIQTGSKKTVRCPMCYSTTPLPLKGVDVFPRNVRLSYEATITKYEAQIKSKSPPSCDECKREPPLETVSFCCTCRGFLCKESHSEHILSRARFLNHKIILLKETKEKDIRDTLKQHMLPPPVKCQEHDENGVKFCCTTCNTLICMECTVIQHQGHKFQELKKFSSNKKQEVVKSVESLPDAVEKLEKTIASGKETKQDVATQKKSVDESIEEAFGELEKALHERKNELLAKSSEISTAKETSLTIQLEELTSLKDQMVACTAVVAEVQESYNDTELLSVVTTLQTRVQELTQRFDKTPLKLREDSTLYLTVDTEALKNEIMAFGSVTEYQPRDYKNFKEPLMSISSNAPYHVALHENGNIVIGNVTGHSINVFDKNGHQKATFGQQNNGVTFQHPLGVDVSGDTVFIVENSGNTVKKLTMTGEQLLNFGNGQLRNPWGCAVSSSGVIYVADRGNNQVQAFNPDGTLSRSIGTSGQLKSPRDVAIDKHSNIHVASYGTKDVKVFTPNGALLKEYGKGLLKGPSGIVVDKDDYCLVGDWEGKSLCIFDPQGKLIHSINFPGCVCGVTLDKDGFVYVAEYSSNKVHKY